MKKYKSVSLYTMWMYISRFLFLLIIPIVQQIILQPTGLMEIFITMWPSILMLFIIVLISFLEYKSIKYTQEKNTLIIKKGIIFKKKLIIPIENINAAIWKYTVILNLLKSKKLSLCTKAGSGYRKNKNAVDLFLKKNELDDILDIRNKVFSVKTGPFKILLMSASWSNPIVSLLIAVPFINKAASIVGEEITEKLYSTMDSLLSFLELGLPPLIASISYLILGAFFVTIIIHFFRYANFKTEFSSKHVVVKSGLISENKKIIDKSKINVIVIKQSLFMIILKLYNAYVHVMGMASGKIEYDLLLAALKEDDLKKALKNIYKDESEKLNTIKPGPKRLKNFLFLPAGMFLFLIVVISIFTGEKWYNKIIVLTYFFIVIITLWWFAVRYFAYKHSRISITSKTLYVNSFKTMSIYSAVIPLQKVQGIKVMRNPLSKWSNLCKVQINVFSGNKDKFICKYIDYNDIKNLFEDSSKFFG